VTHPSVACPEAEGTRQAMMQTIDSSPTMTRDVRCIVLSSRMVHDGAVSSRPHHCRRTRGEACPRQACGLGVRQPSYTKRVVRWSPQMFPFQCTPKPNKSATEGNKPC